METNLMSKPNRSKRLIPARTLALALSWLTLMGCEEPKEHFNFVNDTPGPVHLYFGTIDKGEIAPGQTYNHSARPGAFPGKPFHPIDDEEQFRYAMRLGVTLTDSAGHRRSFDTATLRAHMTRHDRFFTLRIHPGLFEPAR